MGGIMSYIALYRKWRPLVFEDVVEQEHVVKTLKNSIINDRIAHAYLFCGTRGTGKTTMAKIFARAINCLSPKDGDPCNECEICRGILSGTILDVIEIDAASNNSVDNIREIRDEVIYAPSRTKYKVYIIDEVHMLSTGAFNALLKTLEEPPEHVVFILATTEPHKLPATILSRCQRFDFRRITRESIAGRLDRIAQDSGVQLDNEAGMLIAGMADGALRDAISILDQCISLGKSEIAYDDVLTVTGVANESFISGLVDAISGKDVSGVLKLIDQLITEGKNILSFASDLILYYRNMLICCMTKDPSGLLDLSKERLEVMKKQSSRYNKDEIMNVIKELSLMETSLKWAEHPRVMLEVSLLKLCEGICSSQDELLRRVEILEKRLENSEITPRSTPAPLKSSVQQGEKPEAQNEYIKTETKPVSEKPKVRKEKESLEVWGEVLKSLKESGKMLLYSNLEATKAIELSDNKVGIDFEGATGFNKLISSKPENIAILEGLLTKELKKNIKVKILEDGDIPLKSSGEDTEKDDFIEKARDIAQKLNVPFNIVDE
jgi:DNA polymerase-3 subunit gamma/tau